MDQEEVSEWCKLHARAFMTARLAGDPVALEAAMQGLRDDMNSASRDEAAALAARVAEGLSSLAASLAHEIASRTGADPSSLWEKLIREGKA